MNNFDSDIIPKLFTESPFVGRIFSCLFEALVFLVVERVWIFIAHLFYELFPRRTAEESFGEENQAMTRQLFIKTLQLIFLRARRFFLFPLCQAHVFQFEMRI